VTGQLNQAVAAQGGKEASPADASERGSGV